MDEPRNTDFDLHWVPQISGAQKYRAEYVWQGSPATGAHLVIDLPLPGAVKVTVIVEGQEAVT